jgi:hypothetical protein
MKRFKIKNKANGLQFQVERAELGALQPEWGKPEHTVTEPVLTDDGHQVFDSEGRPVMQTRVVPAEFEIVEEDITGEIAANEAKKAAKSAAKARLQSVDWNKVDTVKEAVGILRDHLEAHE